MAWIEVHQELLHHPKNIALATQLRLPEYASAGILVGIWTWALQYAPEGVIPSDREIVVARYIGWRKAKPDLFGVLRSCGWMDGEHVHDWMDYAGRLVRNRRANAERMRAARAGDVQDTFDARAGATVPDLTVPDLEPPLPPAVAGGLAKPSNPRANGTNPRGRKPEPPLAPQPPRFEPPDPLTPEQVLANAMAASDAIEGFRKRHRSPAGCITCGWSVGHADDCSERAVAK